jgi:hypothetical protein
VNVQQETRIRPSRAAYYRWWRVWTPSDWRGSNARSRAKHREQKREYDRKRYDRQQMFRRMDEVQAAEECLRRLGLGD